MTQPFMTGPTLLDSLNGQQYLVLRPTGDVAMFYAAEQAQLRDSLPESISYPHTGHVTLRGFYEPERVHELRDLLAKWAGESPLIELTLDGVDGFPPPFQILIARLARTPSLIEAYSSLTSLLDATDFHRIGELPLDDWIFHLSLIYAGTLEEAEWTAAHESTKRSAAAAEVCGSAEFVWYEDGMEHSEVLTLGGSP